MQRYPPACMQKQCIGMEALVTICASRPSSQMYPIYLVTFNHSATRKRDNILLRKAKIVTAAVMFRAPQCAWQQHFPCAELPAPPTPGRKSGTRLSKTF